MASRCESIGARYELTKTLTPGKVKEVLPTFITKEPAHGTKDTPYRPRCHPERSVFAGGSRSGTPAGNRGGGRRGVLRPRAAHPQAPRHLRRVLLYRHEPLH